MKCRFLFLLAVVAALVSCKKDDIPGGAPEPETPEDMTWRLDKNGTANCYIVSEDGDYAREHPMTFITSSVDANHGDWNHNSRDISLRWL